MSLDVYADQVLRLSQVGGVVRVEYVSLQPDEKMNTVAVPAVRVMIPAEAFLAGLAEMQTFAERLGARPRRARTARTAKTASKKKT